MADYSANFTPIYTLLDSISAKFASDLETLRVSVRSAVEEVSKAASAPTGPTPPVQPTPSPISTPPAPNGVTIGVGAATLLLRMAEDECDGDALFNLAVDGQQLGGNFTVTASHAAGQVQEFAFKGDWGAGEHKAVVTFTNDHWRGTPEADRNLYLESATYNGKDIPGAKLVLLSAGSQTFSFVASAPTATTTPTPVSPAPTVPATPASTYAVADAAGNSIPFLLGVNLAGADFGNVPGSMGRDYGYPDDWQADYFLGRGLKAIRLPFKWERVQPVLGGDLNAQNMTELDRIVNRVHEKGGYPILDVHNYFERWDGGTKRIIRAQGGISQAHFNDLWVRLANRYKHLPRACFNLMNEPVGSDTRTMLIAFNEVTAEIRKSGAKNLILVPGNYWTGAHSWVSTDNDEVMADFTDPLNRFAYDMHQYLDSDSSGTKATAVVGAGATRLVAATGWLKTRKRKAFLGEFNCGANEGGRTELRALLKSMVDNKDAWVGGTWWHATNRLGFGDDEYDADPKDFANLTDLPQVTIMRQALGL